MKKYCKNRFLLALTLLLLAAPALAQERDPFSPTGAGVMSRVRDLVGDNEPVEKPQAFDEANPLTSTQLSAYKVIGVILSETEKIASVKAINGVSYPMKVGDSLGSEGGKISDIDLDGITVQTESQETKLPVNNKMEAPIGGEKK